MAKINLSNQNFGCVTVISKTTNRASNGSIIWECYCNKCNSTIFLSTKQLRSQQFLECSECKKKQELGKKYGELTVESYYPSDKVGHHWLCRCSCGNTTILMTNVLHSGHTLSCGCLQKKIASSQSLIDLTGKTFGRWTVIQKGITSTTARQAKWLCECSCEKHTRREIAGTELRRGTTLSCGCLRASHGEYKITQLLDKAEIKYTVEYKFNTCILPSGLPARFDFWVNNSYIIEFDGVQHFEETDFFHDTLLEIQKRDNYKNNWCKNNNIPIIRIPYFALNSLTILDLIPETSKYLLK